MTDVVAAESDVVIHEVGEWALADFLERIAILSKKSMKILGKPILPVFHGDIQKPITVRGMSRDAEGNAYVRVYHRVSVTAPIIKIEGWTFMATLDHSAAGNIVRTVPGVTIPVSYRTAEPVCDHCGVLRRRNNTFVLRGQDGSFKQIGRQCLRDFIGYDVAALTEMAKWLVSMTPSESDGEGGYGGSGKYRNIDLRKYLAHAHAMIRTYGWVSRSEASMRETLSTAMAAIDNMFPAPRARDQAIQLTTKDYAVAEQALAFVKALKPRSDYEHNLLVVGSNDFISHKECGLAASMVTALFRHQEQEIKRAERMESLKDSQHVGKIGDRLRDLPALVYGFNTFNGRFGATHVFRLRTPDSNILIWYASSEKDLSIGDRVVLTGTVKKHDCYKEIKQTVLTRCKFVVTASDAA